MVSGSRSWTDAVAIRHSFETWRDMTAYATGERVLPTLIHGDANGADRLAAEVAYSMGWAIEPHLADWSLGKYAGLKRNLEMLDENPAHVFIFWDGQSRGTKHVIDEVQKRRQSYEIITEGP
jgi:hypothetical protein